MNYDYTNNGISNYNANNNFNQNNRNKSGRLAINGGNYNNQFDTNFNSNSNMMNSTIPNGNYNNFNSGRYNTVNNNPQYISNPNTNFSNETERKKIFLNNIEAQLTLTNNNKLQETYERKRKDDEKYFSEMLQYNPFGRGGAGAPNRDKYGNVVTSRKALISDVKYQRGRSARDEEQNQMNIPINRNSYNANNSSNNNFSNYPGANAYNQPWINNALENGTNARSINSFDNNNNLEMNYNMNNNWQIPPLNSISNHLYTNMMDNSAYNNSYNNGVAHAQQRDPFNSSDKQMPNNSYINPNIPNYDYNSDGRVTNTFELTANPNYGLTNGVSSMNPYNSNSIGLTNTNAIGNDMKYIGNATYPQQLDNTSQQAFANYTNNSYPNTEGYSNTNLDNRVIQVPTYDITSGKTNFPPENNDTKNQQKLQYGEILREQMRLKEERKEKEKEQRKREEIDEEARLKREQEALKMRDEFEKDKKKAEMDKLKFQNEVIREQYVMVKNKRNHLDNIDVKKEDYQYGANSESEKTIDSNRNRNQIKISVQTLEEPQLPSYQFQVPNSENNPINIAPENQNNFIFIPDNKEDLEIKNTINNEILKLRSNIIDQQSTFIKQLNDLKEETQGANLQRFEAMKEISQLKEELAKQRIDEDLRRKYIYDVMVDKNIRANEIYSHLKLPEINEKELRVELPRIRNHRDNVNNFYKEDKIKHPNRVPIVPNLKEINAEEKMRTTSKFIDIDTHNIVESLNVYEPTYRRNKDRATKLIQRENAKGFFIEGDFALRSYYEDEQSDNDFDDQVRVQVHKKEKYKDLADDVKDHYGTQKEKYKNVYQSPGKYTGYEKDLNRNAFNCASTGDDEVLFAKGSRQEGKKERPPSLPMDSKEDCKYYSSQSSQHDEMHKNDMKNEDALSIHKVYHKNLERLRFLNKLEDEENHNNVDINSKSYFRNLNKEKNHIEAGKSSHTIENKDIYKTNPHENDYSLLHKNYTKAKNFEDFLDKLNNIQNKTTEETRK